MGQFLSDFRDNLAGAVVDNLLANKFGRVLQDASKISVAITSELDSMFATVIIGREILIDGQEVGNTNAAARNPEDVLAQGFGEKGDEVIVKIRNGNAAANEIHLSVFIEQI